MKYSRILAAGALALSLLASACATGDPCPPGAKCGFYDPVPSAPITPDEQPSTDARYSTSAPDNQISNFSFEAATKLCWRQPNYPMCSFDCIENPEREPWNNWCEAEPAPADQILNPGEYTEEELLQILEE